MYKQICRKVSQLTRTAFFRPYPQMHLRFFLQITGAKLFIKNKIMSTYLLIKWYNGKHNSNYEHMKYVTIISFCLLGCKICGRADKSSILYTFFENVCIEINLGIFWIWMSLNYTSKPSIEKLIQPSADLEVQLVQLNHSDGEYSNY